jgi:hypothetical protein
VPEDRHVDEADRGDPELRQRDRRGETDDGVGFSAEVDDAAL